MMRSIKTIAGAFSFAVLTFVKANGQVLPDVQNSFKQYNANTIQEKLFVHTDKSAYTAGELMWFKVYNVNETDHKPIDLSKVVYIEVLDNNQNAVLQAKIAMKDGLGSGSVYLPVNLSTGNFLLRAYTSWMKNFSPDYYFRKKITIINPLKSPEAVAKTSAPVYDIQFFPEGGNLVNGINSVVAFKATDDLGKGVYFKGAIVNEHNDTVARFEPFKFGMGHFMFKPDNSDTYQAVIKIAGKTIKKDLPAVNANGYVMNLKDNGAGQLVVTLTTNLPAESIYLFAHTRNVVKDVETATTDNGSAQFSIDKSKLGEGISHITIFNSQKQPVCERLYFKRPLKKLFISAAADQPDYGTRKKVNIAIGAKDAGSNPVIADLSLSVYRIDTLQHADKENIENYLWLSADLRGNIESPEYYFTDANAETDEAVDNLMLTQGWRRFEWSSILSNKVPAFTFLPEYNGPIITAKLINLATNKPQKDIVTYLAIPGKSVQLYTSQSDSLGRLIYNMKDFYGPGEIVAQTNTEVDTGYRIDILNPFSEQYAKIALPRFTVTADMETTFTEHSLAAQLQNIYTATKLRQFYDAGADSSAFYGTPDKTYLLDDYTRFLTMEEVMREYVKECFVTHLHNQFHIKTINETPFLPEGDPMVLLDGVPFFNMNKVFSIDPLRIRKLEVVPYTYYWGPSTESGIFSYTSYKSDLAGIEIDPHAVVLDYEGLELQRKFYSPNYDTDNAYKSRIPDFRNVLYWAPNVITDEQGKNSVSFYTSDHTGSYMGMIQGLTANGNTGYQYFTFTVSK